MKKMLVALAVVAIASASQAAIYQWRLGAMTGNKVYKMNDTDVCASSTMYLFSSTDYAQDSLLTALGKATDTAARTKILEGAIDQYALGTSGNQKTYKEISGFGTETDSKAHNYFAILTTVDGNDYVYLSNDVPTNIPGEDDEYASLSFGGQDASQKKAYDLGSTYAGEGGKGAGWYQFGSVPEPTSGLLLLLGVAGLALRRRRA